MIAAADSLMQIFGYTRVECRYCVYSLGTDKADMYCERRDELVNKCERNPTPLGVW